MKKLNLILMSAIVCLATVLFSAKANAAEINWYGPTYTFWPAPSVYTYFTELNDADDPASAVSDKLDILGDSVNPAFGYTMNNDFIFFRFQVDINTITTSTYADNFFIYINTDEHPSNPATAPDYAIAWDTMGGTKDDHGLEFLLPLSTDGTYGGTTFQDIDNNIAKKISPPDISDTEGMVRTLDNLSTTNLGTVSAIEIAVSKAYLALHTSASPDMFAPGVGTQFGYADSKSRTDHQFANTDYPANGVTESLISYGGNQLLGGPVPEPATVISALLGLLGFALKRFKKK